MSSWLEFEDKMVENALMKASEQLGIPKEKIRYDVISYGSSGIFGLVGVKKAKIRVNLPKSIQKNKSNGSKSPAAKAETFNLSDETSSMWPSYSDDASQLVEEAFGRKTKPVSQTPESDEPAPSVGNTEEEMENALAFGKEVLQRIIDFITTDARITTQKEAGEITFRVEGGNSAVLIGKHGQTLEAIGYLVEKIINKRLTERIRIQVDIEGYLENRKKRLINLASRLAQKAKQSGKPATIGELNSHDRRIVHLALKEDNRVRTQSVGDGLYRKLIIFPKKRGGKRRRKKATKQ